MTTLGRFSPDRAMGARALDGREDHPWMSRQVLGPTPALTGSNEEGKEATCHGLYFFTSLMR